MNEQEIVLRIKIIAKWIKEAEARLQQAVDREDWRTVGEKDAYLAALC